MHQLLQRAAICLLVHTMYYWSESIILDSCSLSPVNQSAYVGLENLSALAAGCQRDCLCPHELLQWIKWTETLHRSPQSKVPGTL